MRKNITIIAVLAAIFIGFGYFAIFSTPANENIATIEESNKEFSQEFEASVPNEPVAGVGTLQELLDLGLNIECTIHYQPSEEEAEVEGTYFVGNGNVRGDFLARTPELEGPILSSLIMANGMVYVWSEIEGEKYGVKMPIPDEETGDNEGHTNQPVAMDDQVSYDCKPWQNVDNTVFLPPSDVLFQDFSDIMNAGMEYGTIYEEGEFAQ